MKDEHGKIAGECERYQMSLAQIKMAQAHSTCSISYLKEMSYMMKAA